MSDLSRFIPTPEQIQALAAGFQRIGLVAQQATDNMVEAFAAAARQLERERAKARREAQWHRQQEKNIIRQQLDHDPTYFGRKRRGRRARGRRIEARRAFLELLAQYLERIARGLLFHHHQRTWIPSQHAPISIHHFPPATAEAARFLDPSLGEPWEEQADV